MKYQPTPGDIRHACRYRTTDEDGRIHGRWRIRTGTGDHASIFHARRWSVITISICIFYRHTYTSEAIYSLPLFHEKTLNPHTPFDTSRIVLSDHFHSEMTYRR